MAPYEILEPLSDVTGFIREISTDGLFIDAVLVCDKKIRLSFRSSRELESTKRTLLKYIGEAVQIFVDDNGVPHVGGLAKKSD
ncbi:MAG TPA: hypothetical protein VE862_09130 [Candidatus Acidoferrum sp.]|nr:hypothetical protein [Candidatus Acidoferrum sp.]